MQEEKTIMPERADVPEAVVNKVMFILPNGEIPLLNTIAGCAVGSMSGLPSGISASCATAARYRLFGSVQNAW